MFVAGSIKDPIVRFLGKLRRGYSIVFDNLCLMLWTIGISDFEMLGMVNGCDLKLIRNCSYHVSFQLCIIEAHPYGRAET